MRINSAAILRVKIAWSRASKQLVPSTDAYKMAATSVFVLWLMQLFFSYAHVGAGNTIATIFFEKLKI